MNFSLRPTIQAFAADVVAPRRRISCATSLWNAGLTELAKRGRGEGESGAFLLGSTSCSNHGERRRVARFVYYDDLDPQAIDRGIVIFDGNGFGPLWQICRESDLTVVADVHTHPQQSRQSDADRRHPMIAMRGHIALIVPNFAQRVPPVDELGIYEYTGAHQWRDHSGPRGRDFLYIGLWG